MLTKAQKEKYRIQKKIVIQDMVENCNIKYNCSGIREGGRRTTWRVTTNIF
jgi:hypothetical protein